MGSSIVGADTATTHVGNNYISNNTSSEEQVVNQIIGTDIFHLIYNIEDRKWDELISNVTEFDCSMRDKNSIVDRVEWLRAQTHPDHIIEQTCQLVREVLSLAPRA